MTAPVAPESRLIPSKLATQRAVSPCINTVSIMVRKTRALIESPPLIPRSVKRIANKEATEALTIPLGATHDKNNFCRQFNSLFQVHKVILVGRTKNINTKTVKRLPQPRAKILAIDKSAASRTNNTETQRTVN